MKTFTNTGEENSYDIVHMKGDKDKYTLTENSGTLTYENLDRRYIITNVEEMGFNYSNGTATNFKWDDEFAPFDITPMNEVVELYSAHGRGMEYVNNGTPLTIGDEAAAWVDYMDLPSELQNQWGTTNINDNGSASTVSFVVTETVQAYLLRIDGWNSVPLTGWDVYTPNITNFTTYSANDGTIYTRTLTPGTYNYETYSAMYIFKLV